MSNRKLALDVATLNRNSSRKSISSSPRPPTLTNSLLNPKDRKITRIYGNNLTFDKPYANLAQDYSLPTEVMLGETPSSSRMSLDLNNAQKRNTSHQKEFRISNNKSNRVSLMTAKVPAGVKENIQANSRLVEKRQHLLEMQQKQANERKMQ